VPTVGYSYSADDTLLNETYDGDGNVTATGSKTFSYDSQNELISANGGAVTVEYDGFGNRVSKTASGVTTKYLVEDDVNPTGYPQVFDELTGSTVTRTHTYGLQRISENQVIDNVWTPSFYGYDGMSTVRQLTNTAGVVTDTFEYDSFGNAITHTGTTPNNYLYRAEQFDPDLGLYYLRARYYNPLTGRFLSRDPDDGLLGTPNTLHKYIYADGDPVNGADPMGREDLNETNKLMARQIASVDLRARRFRAVVATAICLIENGISIAASYRNEPDPVPRDWNLGCYAFAISQAAPELRLLLINATSGTSY
jgi:RHS repeat-associated protein